MMKRFVSIIILTALLICNVTPVYGLLGKEHKKDYEMVLFGSIKLDKKQSQISEALASAAYLTIDQYKNTGQNSLDFLEEYGVMKLPTIDDISIEGSGKHRIYAHNGWDSEYHKLKYRDRYDDPQWDKKWKLRKGIIENTVNKVFDFDWWSGIPLIGEKLPSSNEECDSFCALIYYVHLIGDHEETHTMDEYKLLLPLGGRMLSDTVVSELEYHCEVLFENQSDTNEYDHLEKAFRRINDDCRKMGIVNERNLKKNQEIAEQLMEALKTDIPKLLQNEEFFSNAVL